MAEAVVAYVAEAVIAEGYITAGYAIMAYGATVIQFMGLVGSIYAMRQQQKKAEEAAKAQYNASLKDRYVMVRSAIEPRQYVLGRQRVSGPMAFVTSYGSQKERLIVVLPLAAHEIDAVEAVYFDDKPVAMDGNGNVSGVYSRDQWAYLANTTSRTVTTSTAPDAATVTAWVDYGTTRVAATVTSVSGTSVTVTTPSSSATGTLTVRYVQANHPLGVGRPQSATASISIVNGAGSVTLPNTPLSGSVSLVVNGQIMTVSVNGKVVTAPSVYDEGAPVTGTYTLNYQYADGATKARIWWYLGAPGQTADATLMSALPGMWTSAHKMSGMAYLIMDALYDQDAWPQGIPNISAVIRGAKVYDPRTGTTAWSENPALLSRWVTTHPQIGNRPASDVNDTALIAAANACDVSVTYTVNGRYYNRKMYTAGLVIQSGTKCADVLNALAQAMAGRWAHIDGQMRVMAGAYATPVLTLDETWLHRGGSITVSPTVPRETLTNVITGTFANEEDDYRVEAYPRVQANAYITADGRELPTDMPLNAVTNVGQAQQVAAVYLRDARQAERVTLTCNMRAYAVEWGDTINVTLSRFGWSAKPFLVTSTSFTADGGIQLTLKETDPSIYALGTSFAAVDPAPNTSLRSPNVVSDVPVLTVTTGNSTMLKLGDGTIIPRFKVAWTLPSDPAVTGVGGSSEVLYGVAGTAESTWMRATAPAGASELYLDGVLDRQAYVIKARFGNGLVFGMWGTQVTQVALGKSAVPTAPTALAVTETSTAQRQFSVTHAQDLDHAGYIVLYSTNTSAAITSMSLIAAQWGGDGKVYESSVPPDGTYRFAVAAIDTSGNYSAAAYVTATLTGIAALGAAASAAQASANQALSQLQIISSDGYLSRSEKPVAIQDWLDISNGFATIDAQAAAYGITTERTAYANAKTALSAYLGGLSPAWDNTAVDTVIVPATWRATWDACYQARTTLMTKIAAVAGTDALRSSSANQCFDADFTVGAATGSWTYTGGPAPLDSYAIATDPNWILNGGVGASTNTIALHQTGTLNHPVDWYAEVMSQPIPLEANTRYCVSAYTGAHRCKVAVFAYLYDAAGNVVGNTYTAATVENSAYSGGTALSGYQRCYSFIAASGTPAAYAKLVLRKYDTTVGQADSWMFACRAQVERVGDMATGPGPWSPGPSAAKFGENVFGQAKTDDIEAGAATNIVTSNDINTYNIYAAGYFSGGQTGQLPAGAQQSGFIIQYVAYTATTACTAMVRCSFVYETSTLAGFNNVDYSSSANIGYLLMHPSGPGVGPDQSVELLQSGGVVQVTFKVPISGPGACVFNLNITCGGARINTIKAPSVTVEVIKR